MLVFYFIALQMYFQVGAFEMQRATQWVPP